MTQGSEQRPSESRIEAIAIAAPRVRWSRCGTEVNQLRPEGLGEGGAGPARSYRPRVALSTRSVSCAKRQIAGRGLPSFARQGRRCRSRQNRRGSFVFVAELRRSRATRRTTVKSLRPARRTTGCAGPCGSLERRQASLEVQPAKLRANQKARLESKLAALRPVRKTLSKLLVRLRLLELRTAR